MYTIGSSQYYITNNNQLYTFGKNISGRLGIGNTFGQNTTFEKHIYFDGKYIETISESRNCFHCIVYSDNKLYGCGNNQHKQIHDSISDAIYYPVIMCDVSDIFKSPIKQIASGMNHTLFLTENGSVYGSGKNHMNQLLLDDRHKLYDITLIPKLKHIINICCGVMNLFGQNRNGCLGANLSGTDYNAPGSFNEISISTGKIIDINCGRGHVGYITSNNELYMFGRNSYRQCAVESSTKVITPEKVKFDKKIIDLKCGSNHNIIKSKNGDFYSFGWNSEGQCLKKTIHPHKICQPMLLSLKYLKDKIGNNNDIIGLIPTYIQTFILQKI